MESTENETIVHIAIVVDDIEKYLDSYAQVFGIERPTWRMTDTKDVTHAKYKGKDTDARAKLAFIRFANLSIEITEPVGEPSTWADYLKEHGPSVHHIAFRYKDKKPMLDKLTKTLKIVHAGEFKGGNYTYLDAFDKLGMDIEILENPGM
jgi:catechol 2,3-dioxygenase-like lactoylglutathione lyase family enzyme